MYFSWHFLTDAGNLVFDISISNPEGGPFSDTGDNNQENSEEYTV
jgi:hypothetical protein